MGSISPSARARKHWIKITKKSHSMFDPETRKNAFVAGANPQPHWGSLQRSPGPLAGLMEATSRARGRFEAALETSGYGPAYGGSFYFILIKLCTVVWDLKTEFVKSRNLIKTHPLSCPNSLPT